MAQGQQTQRLCCQKWGLVLRLALGLACRHDSQCTWTVWQRLGSLQQGAGMTPLACCRSKEIRKKLAAAEKRRKAVGCLPQLSDSMAH